MAYNKKTWLARLGQGLNKFSIDGATPVPIISQPDSVTQQGDALSAGNLNDLEQRIADAFDDVEESKADKSTTEALQSQINQHESRLENLEQKAGDYTIVQYRGTNAVPTGKAKYGLVKSIVGKTRAWNQLVKNGNFADTSNWALNGTGTFTVSDGVASVTCNEANRLEQSLGSLIIGHKYLVSLRLKFSVADYEYFSIRLSDLTHDIHVPYSETTSWQNVSAIVDNTQISAGAYLLFRDVRTNKSEFKITNVILRDITPIFPDLPSTDLVTSNIPNLVKRCPDLLKYDVYDAGSLVDTEVSGVESVGVNIWDEEWELGDYSSSTGEKVPSSNYIRCKNRIEVIQGGTYYWNAPTTGVMYFYDANDNYLPDISNVDWTIASRVHTLDSRVRYIRFRLSSAYGTTYKHDIQICLNSLPDAIKTVYHPYKTDTLSLSETVTLRSDDELMLETGTIVRKMVRVDLSDYDWSYSNGYWYMASGTKKDSFTNIVKGFGGSHVPNWVSAKYEIVKGSEVVLGVKLYAIGQSSDNSIICHNGSNTTPPSGALVAELATPTIESIDPIIDNFLEVQGGGTVETIQTQTPVIDNCLDVGYLTV